MSLPRHFSQRPRRQLPPPPRPHHPARGEVEPVAVEEAVVVAPAAEPVVWDMTLKKVELLAIAAKLGVVADDTMTKAQIIAALDATKV